MHKHELMYSEANGETNVLQRVLHIQMQKHEYARINRSTQEAVITTQTGFCK